MGIIRTEDLKAIVADGNVVIVDARGGADAYDRYTSGHLKDARFVDLETDISTKSGNPAQGGRHPLPSPQDFGLLLSRLGISPSTDVVIYDDKRGANAAARFWWMLKAAGHEKVYVVSGGLESLVKEGFEINTGEQPISSQYASYPLESWQLATVSLDQVSEAIDDPNALIIDVRENYRYRGESEPIDTVAGHIPNAINIPYTTNLDENGEFLSATQLSEKYKTALKGYDSANVIVHCGSGVTACHTLLAMSEAGITDPALYVGSWSEWSRNDFPVATEE